MKLTPSLRWLTGACLLASVPPLFVSCGDDDGVAAGEGGASGADGGEAGSGGIGGESAGGQSYLTIVTERESSDASLQYLHVVTDWPKDGELDYSRAIELGEFVNVHAMGSAVFVQSPDDGTVRKFTFDAAGEVVEDETISFAHLGVTVSGDMVYAGERRAFFIDEAAGLVVAWDPKSLSIRGSTDLAEAALERDGMAAQVSRGVALGGEGFVSFSWRDWESYSYHDAAAIGVFDATSDDPELEVIEDDRCASTVTVPYDGGDGFVYLVSDAALGFDALANPTLTEKKLCVLRVRPGTREIDQAFLVDLGEVLDSPGFYGVHPMANGKLLVNVWASDVEVSDVADPEDPSWYWNAPPYFEFSIVDFESRTATPVSAIPRAAVQWSVSARVDGDTFVQAYGDDGGSDLYRVSADATVTRVLVNGQGTDVQYLGRVAP